MTLIEAQGVLLNFFLENEAFDPREDFDAVVSPKTITRNLDKAIIIAALDNLEKQGIVTCVVLDDKDEPPVWVLDKPLSMRQHTIELSFPVAHAVAETLNAASGDKPVVDVFHLDEEAIAGLVGIIQQLALAKKNGKAE